MNRHLPRIFRKWVVNCLVVLAAMAAVATWRQWFPTTHAWVNHSIIYFRSSPESGDHAEADHFADSYGQESHQHGENAFHEHASHAGHDDSSCLELSDQALRNIGLSPENLREIELSTFRKSITVPAAVVERPGRTRVQVATPMTGVITHVHALEGEAVDPETLLFEIRLTHEDLVQAQTDFLRTLGELDVERREIARLDSVTRSGAIAGKVLLERKYARDKLEAQLRAQQEALRLHGLSSDQVQQIATERRLLRDLRIYAPSADGHSDGELKLTKRPIRTIAFMPSGPDRLPVDDKPVTALVLQKLNVHKGQSVNAGETLCILTYYDELYVEGSAFEQDIAQLRNAAQRGWTVEAIFDQPGCTTEIVNGLKIAFSASQVDTESRTLHFYVMLPNKVVTDKRVNGSRFVEWKYLPGQRLQLRVPVEEWPDKIVLPVDAVAREGAECFVFQQNGKHFDRVPVHVEYRDQFSVVIANDGSLFPGDVVAWRGAHQMQMALKNKSGGGVDPHAGHNH
jgi:multidrug efflux pump subunit AcrA (membrane-fusion protein)